MKIPKGKISEKEFEKMFEWATRHEGESMNDLRKDFNKVFHIDDRPKTGKGREK